MMKIYIVFDSEAGHTEQLARSIAKGAESVEGAEVFINHVKKANVKDLEEMDAIIWGCPGHFGTISSGLKEWIDKLGYLWASGKLVDKTGRRILHDGNHPRRDRSHLAELDHADAASRDDDRRLAGQYSGERAVRQLLRRRGNVSRRRYP